MTVAGTLTLLFYVLVLFLCSINANVCTMFRYDSVISQHCHINFFIPVFLSGPVFLFNHLAVFFMLRQILEFVFPRVI